MSNIELLSSPIEGHSEITYHKAKFHKYGSSSCGCGNVAVLAPVRLSLWRHTLSVSSRATLFPLPLPDSLTSTCRGQLRNDVLQPACCQQMLFSCNVFLNSDPFSWMISHSP